MACSALDIRDFDSTQDRYGVVKNKDSDITYLFYYYSV